MTDNADEIAHFLRARVESRASNVTFLGAGMFSRAFAFEAGDARFVVRVNAFEEDFRKDEFARRTFASSRLPVPRVLDIGAFDHHRWYCITERCTGVSPEDYDAAGMVRLAPALFDALDALHSADTSRFDGWGLTYADGRGRFASWPHAILSLFDQKSHRDWPRIASAAFWDARLFDAGYGAVRRLLDFAPREKYFVHGDFAGSNLVADGDRLTGVLDWAEMNLGDFVDDIAYLDYWDDEPRLAERWRERAAREGRAVPHFAERLRCYQLNIALNSIVIAAQHNDEADFAEQATHLEKLLRE